jgi:hypothetical protein
VGVGGGRSWREVVGWVASTSCSLEGMRERESVCVCVREREFLECEVARMEMAEQLGQCNNNPAKEVSRV